MRGGSHLRSHRATHFSSFSSYGSSRNVATRVFIQSRPCSAGTGWTSSGSGMPSSLSASSNSDPVDVPVQVGVTDEAHRVDDRVSDDQRHDAPGALEPPAEDQPHHRIADEAAVALVQVIGAAQHGG